MSVSISLNCCCSSQVSWAQGPTTAHQLEVMLVLCDTWLTVYQTLCSQFSTEQTTFISLCSQFNTEQTTFISLCHYMYALLQPFAGSPTDFVLLSHVTHLHSILPGLQQTPTQAYRLHIWHNYDIHGCREAAVLEHTTTINIHSQCFCMTGSQGS